MRLAAAALFLLGALLGGARAEAPKRVLLVGDSHTVGTYGQTLVRKFAEAGAEVSAYAVCGSSIRWWLAHPHPAQPCAGHFLRPPQTGSISQPAGRYQVPPPALSGMADFDLVIVGLGSNSGGDAASIGRLLAALPARARKVWVTPPPMPSRLAAVRAFNAALPGAIDASGVSCAVIESARWLGPEDASADHFNGAPGKRWAEGVFGALGL